MSLITPRQSCLGGAFSSAYHCVPAMRSQAPTSTAPHLIGSAPMTPANKSTTAGAANAANRAGSTPFDGVVSLRKRYGPAIAATAQPAANPSPPLAALLFHASHPAASAATSSIPAASGRPAPVCQND